MYWFLHVREVAWVLSAACFSFTAGHVSNAQTNDKPVPRLVFMDDFNIATGTPFALIGTQQTSELAGQDAQQLRSLKDILRSKASGGFGGISGIAYDENSGQLWTLSDSTKPVVFSFYLSLTEATLTLRPAQMFLLRDQQGQPVAEWSMDPEGLALLPTGTLLIASEGFAAGIAEAGVAPANPALFEFDLRGRLLRTFAAPPPLLGLSADPQGTHVNFGLESLTCSPSRERVFLAPEGSLKQDGPLPDLRNGSRLRIFECTLASNLLSPQHEYFYTVEAPPTPPGFREPRGSRGLSEMLAIGEQELITLERSFLRETGTGSGTPRSDQRIEIYYIDLSTAADVQQAISLRGPGSRQFPSVQKTLLLDLRDIIPELNAEYRALDNFEGMCLGPRLADGSRTVILVSDNNFNPLQRTVFLAFKLLLD